MIVWDGSLACLAAARTALHAADAEGADAVITAWVPPPGSIRTRPGLPDVEPALRRAAIEAQARIAMLAGIEEWGPAEAQAVGEPLADVRLLLAGLAAASRAGCKRLVWPVAVGEDLGELQRVSDLVACLNTLLHCEAGAMGAGEDESGPGLRLDAPFADLTAQALEELARDQGVVLEAAAEHARDPADASG